MLDLRTRLSHSATIRATSTIAIYEAQAARPDRKERS
jgi:hypothetical protein